MVDFVICFGLRSGLLYNLQPVRPLQLSLNFEDWPSCLPFEIETYFVPSGFLFGRPRTADPVWFLGGLSLHLNHLIAERVSAPYRQFGTLPIGICLSNLDSGQLETSVMTSYCHF